MVTYGFQFILYMCVINWSPMRLQTNRGAVPHCSNGPEDLHLRLFPSFLTDLSSFPVGSQKTAQNTVAGFPRASDPKERESIQKGGKLSSTS